MLLMYTTFLYEHIEVRCRSKFLVEFANLAAEVILGVAGAHELAIIAIGGGAFNKLGGVGPSVELEAELVESLHFRLI